MSNAWLSIPLEDYEGHMNSPGVQQLTALAELFARALAACSPASVAVLGVAGGNGLERIDCAVTKRIVGVDINPLYLETVRQRCGLLAGLELHCADIARDALGVAPVDLVHAALIFEHTGLGRALDNALSLVAPQGRLSVVLQLPGEAGQDVAVTGFTSIQTLKDGFALIGAASLEAQLGTRGFRMTGSEHRPVPGGKALWLGIFERCRHCS